MTEPRKRSKCIFHSYAMRAIVGRIRTRTRLWEDFQASVSTPPPRKQPEVKKTIKVVKKYRFAGEDVT